MCEMADAPIMSDMEFSAVGQQIRNRNGVANNNAERGGALCQATRVVP